VADEAHATTGPEDDEDGIHRLRDIVVEEVSLVDRAANKRRFLVVKRSDDMADERKVDADEKRKGPGAEGVRVEKVKKPKDATDVATEKARRRADDDDAEDETKKARRKEEEAEKARSRTNEEDEDDTRKARDDGEDEDEDEEEDDEDCDDEVEKSRPGPKGKGGESDSEEDEEEDDATRKSTGGAVGRSNRDAVLQTLTKALEQLMEVAKTVQNAGTTDAKASVADSVGRELSSITQLLDSVGGRRTAAAAKAPVVKAGARMAKERLDRFQKALALLSEVLKELTDAKEPSGPTAGAAEDKVGKRDATSVPGMRELVAGIGELTRVVKRQEDELARIRQTRGVSNAIPVDGGGRRSEPQEVSWPLDMNRPISKDTVAKAVSFFEDA
jgi:hypothetical protein